MKVIRFMAFGLILSTLPLPSLTKAQTGIAGPVELRVDDLKMPLGIDDAAPRFSWQLRDPTRGALQSAYEVLVASKAELLRVGKADIWDSGRVNSDASLNVRYAGPVISPSTRYFWLVKVWGETGKLYPTSKIEWWETGLLKKEGWRGAWIGYETPEEAAVRYA